MLRLRQPQLSLVGDLLPAELRRLPEGLAEIDRLLDDDRFMAPFLERFNTKIGRPTIPVERYVRLMYLKFQYGFGYERLVAEVADSLTWRLFCRISLDESPPHSTTLVKLTRKYGKDVVRALNETLVTKLAEEKLVQGRKMRTDTTVVAANIEHPTDSDLLHDGIRYIDRCAKKIGEVSKTVVGGFRSGVRTAAKLVWQIGVTLKTKASELAKEAAGAAAQVAEGMLDNTRAGLGRVNTAVTAAVGQAVESAKVVAGQAAAAAVATGEAAVAAAGTAAGAVMGAAEQFALGLEKAGGQMVQTAGKLAEQMSDATHAAVTKGKAAAKTAQEKVSATRQRVDELTRQMAELACKTVAHGNAVLRRLHELRERASEKAVDKLKALESNLDDALTITRRVLEQTGQRLAGVTSIPNRLISIFDRQARPIRRGKMSQPVEFGYKAQITEVEGGVVSDYRVFEGNPSDSGMAVHPVEHHKKQFGHVPHAVATDMGFSSAENEHELKKKGVKHVGMPARGKLDAKRRKHQAQSWFQRLQRWRTGCEATISRLKRRNQMDRSMLWGLHGTEMWVGFSVFSQNLGRVKLLKQAKATRAAARAARNASKVGPMMEVMAHG